MNYFAHGVRFRGRPWFVAGTAVPDWLGVADRRVRLRPRDVAPFAARAEGPQAELAAGILQHLDDDRWFHGTEAFGETSAAVSELFRRAVGADNGFRPGFLGHITTELVLDGLLIEEDPPRLDEYYRDLGQVEPELVEATVNAISPRSTDRLAGFIARFLETEFLRDYSDAARLRRRLNQVLSRVRLQPLPREVEGVLRSARPVVRRRMGELLPSEE